MKKTQEQVELYKTRIRSIMITNPDVSNRDIVDVLEKNGLKLDKDYVNILKKKIQSEQQHFFSKQNIRRVGELSDELKETSKKLWRIVLSDGSADMAKIAAIKELRDAKVTFIKILQTIPGAMDVRPKEIKITDGTDPASDDMIEKVAESWAKQFNPTTKPVIYQEPTAEEAIIEPNQITNR